MRGAKTFTIAWNAVHVPVESLFTITWKPCSRSRGIRRRHGVNTNQVFSWRRAYRRGALAGRSVENRRDRKTPALLPVQIHVPMKVAPQEARAAPVSPASQPERVEIEFPSGTRLRIWGGLGTERLQAILRELSGPC